MKKAKSAVKATKKAPVKPVKKVAKPAVSGRADTVVIEFKLDDLSDNTVKKLAAIAKATHKTIPDIISFLVGKVDLPSERKAKPATKKPAKKPAAVKKPAAKKQTAKKPAAKCKRK